MKTEILKLDRPYEYIYCNGSIGLHIATMIVYEAKTDEDGDYELETHSHPVVKYRELPGGTVWNKAELTDCNVLCSEDDKCISMQKFYYFVSSIGRMRLSERGEADDYALTVDAPSWKGVLDLNGIAIKWPMLEEDGELKPQDKFYVNIVVEHNPEGAKFKYTMHDYGASDIIFSGGAELYFFAEFNTKEDLALILMNGMMSYYAAFSDHQFTIVFDAMDDHEFADVIEKVNSKEKIIRQETHDADV